MQFDLTLHNATVIDGTGRKRYRADLGIANGKIAAISANGSGTLPAGVASMDVDGLVVAPGFIDMHSHADWVLPLPDHPEILAPLALQGITTIVGGNCGFSPAPVIPGKETALDDISAMLRDRSFSYRWDSFTSFRETMQSDGLLLNAAFLVGHGSLRAMVMGSSSQAPNANEMKAMQALLQQALREGAYGFSAGLAYAPGVFAQNDELLALLQVVAEEDTLFTVHGRAYSWVSPFYKPMFFGAAHNLRSVRELIGLAKQAGARLQLSHQIFVGRRTWRTYRSVLKEIERAVEAGQDVAFDAFPYTVGNSTIKVIFPEWFLDGFSRKMNDSDSLKKLKREINLLQIALGIEYADLLLMGSGNPELKELEGLNFAEISQRLGLPPFEAYMQVARFTDGEANILLGTYSGDAWREEPLQAALAHPLCAFMTDTILTSRGAQNPASYGTFPRIMGRYSRDLGLFSLEEAIRRTTSYAAERIGLEGIGRIAEGLWADLVIFNPDTIADNTTLKKSEAAPSGIQAVLISGKVVVQDGNLIPGKRSGRVLSC